MIFITNTSKLITISLAPLFILTASALPSTTNQEPKDPNYILLPDQTNNKLYGGIIDNSQFDSHQDQPTPKPLQPDTNPQVDFAKRLEDFEKSKEEFYKRREQIFGKKKANAPVSNPQEAMYMGRLAYHFATQKHDLSHKLALIEIKDKKFSPNQAEPWLTTLESLEELNDALLLIFQRWEEEKHVQLMKLEKFNIQSLREELQSLLNTLDSPTQESLQGILKINGVWLTKEKFNQLFPNQHN